MTPSTLACRNGATTGRRWRLLAMLAVVAVCTATRTADAGFSCVPEGAACDDGLKCTVFDECHNGQCIGSSKICNAADLCLQGACNPDTGQCEYTPKNCDDQNVCTADSCDSSTGDCVHDPVDAICDDGNPCTVFDECHNGQCSGSSKICNSADLCLQGACNPDTGLCEYAPKNCDDQNVCTADSCDSSTGNCVHDPLTGPTCDDGDNCTTDDQCNDGRCEGTPRTCPQGRCAFVPVGCFADQDCNFTFCASPEDAVPALPQGCETNADCTTPPYTVCTPSHCTLPPCLFGDCDPASGDCAFFPKLNDTECDDGSGCTMNDVCLDSECSGTPVACDDEDTCTDDTCESQQNQPLCVYTPNGSCTPPTCGDGLLDAPGETCDPPDPTINPATGQVTCRPDCTFCGDGVVQAMDQETCDDGNTVSGCRPDRPQQALDACQNDCTPPICADPAKITFGRDLDRFDFHGRLIVRDGDAAVDPAGQMLVLQLVDPAGAVVFRASVLQGGIERTVTGSYRYWNKQARTRGGVARLYVQRVRGAYRAKIRSYGDLSAAQSNMTTQVFIGLQEWTIAGQWEAMRGGWRLTAEGTVAH